MGQLHKGFKCAVNVAISFPRGEGGGRGVSQIAWAIIKIFVLKERNQRREARHTRAFLLPPPPRPRAPLGSLGLSFIQLGPEPGVAVSSPGVRKIYDTI